MRLCRFRYQHQIHLGLYDEKSVISLSMAAGTYFLFTSRQIGLPKSDELVEFLPPNPAYEKVKELVAWMTSESTRLPAGVAIPTENVELLVPIARPNKLFLLAGNYADHVRERGGTAAERAETFPYVFMKPPSTTLTHPGVAVHIPKVSPAAVDWELELGVVMGRHARHVSEADALSYVAGYTIVNDISDRKFRPNPERKKRERDTFFDWLHGKWHDGFCPCGPCVTTSDEIVSPQMLDMKLRLNGKLMQDGSTAQQVFPVAAVIAFLSNLVTLEPGDIISTGTPSGVGSASGTFLKPGDVLEGSIARIGTLRTPIVAEE
ncbi:MAG TPA: fumarylacetoacetate hydrolase family protein [Pirellulales bacterium]|jgi:2-keto-4-pentenoate hydratase/2-oxohepta-3-ene-1,7-dioic acid hydratase in catechol pathway|nr:fumarylacetoacetate hydrolase family protein [Pirellulales bacterium]